MIFFFFCVCVLLLNYMCNIYEYVQLITDVQISSRYQSVGGSAEQPLQDPSGRALNLPRPHPSNKTV